MLRFWFQPIFITWNTFDITFFPLVLLICFHFDSPITASNWPILFAPLLMGLIFGRMSRSGERALAHQQKDRRNESR